MIIQRTVLLSDIDATGVIYFSRVFEYAQQAFELFLSKHINLPEMIEKKQVLLPIVHAEADYTLPIRVGDQLGIKIELIAQGESSFTLGFEFLLKEKKAAQAKIIHAYLNPQLGKAQPLSDEIKALLERISQDR